MRTHQTTSYAEALAVLSDPRLSVGPPAVASLDPIDALRRQLCRFSDGADHERRRVIVVDRLADLLPSAVRTGAAERTTRTLAPIPVGSTIDLMATIARTVPLQVLADLLGVDVAPADVIAIVVGLRPTAADGERLAAAATADAVLGCPGFGAIGTEVRANLLGLLIQTCDATAGLIGAAVLQASRTVGVSPEAAVDEVLRLEPPVVLTRRFTAGPDTELLVDLDRATRDPEAPAGARPTFGLGPRACPGADLAVALAVGVLEAVAELVDLSRARHIGTEVHPNLRVPASIVVTRREPVGIGGAGVPPIHTGTRGQVADALQPGSRPR